MAYVGLQVVFQDPFSSLSPRMRVEDIIAEPLEIHSGLSRAAIAERVRVVLELVGLTARRRSAPRGSPCSVGGSR
jgi:peptide/nickel transport system ATP-binding protein/oligopeptide transport system ATP-binding protein